MASTSSVEIATEILACCLEGRRRPDALLDELIGRATSQNEPEAREATRALFGIIVERLADLFEPRLCDAYVDLFSRVIERVGGDIGSSDPVTRYQRVRQVRTFSGPDPDVVYVLSRVTLGADVAVTSVVLDAVKRRFPNAHIRFVGSRKNWALFEGDARVELQEFSYGRGGTLRERLASTPQLHLRNAIVVDADSRLTQLGLVPVCDEDRYYFFESRGYGGDSSRTLKDITGEWVSRVFAVHEPRAYIAPRRSEFDAEITLSFGVGENEEKRLSDQFEGGVVEHLAAMGRTILLDTGAGGEERQRAERLAQQAPANVSLWRGEYAPFASAISRSRVYVGYDSAGQHVAAACGVPLVSVFAGYASQRMYERWKPSGPGPIRTIQVADRRDPNVLRQTIAAIDELLG